MKHNLTERLRALSEEWFECCDDIHLPLAEAAARIEALERALRHITTMQDGEQAWWARDVAACALEEAKVAA